MRRLFDTGNRLQPGVHRTGALLAIVVAALVAIAWQRRGITLADPATCPGLLDHLLPLVLRRIDDLRVGTLLTWTNGAIAVAAVAAFTRLAHVLSGSPICAAAAAAAMAATATFDRTLRPADGLAVLGLWCAAGLALARAQEDESRSAVALRLTLAALSIVPLLAPRLLLPALALAVVAAASRRPEVGRARVVILTTAAAGVLLLMVRSFTTFGPAGSVRLSLAGCVAPAWPEGAGARDAIAAALGNLGPFPIGLAALGVFIAAGRSRSRFGVTAIVWAAAPLLAERASGDAALAVSAAVFWCFVAIGLSEVMVEGRLTFARRVAAVLLLILLPVLQYQRLPVSESAATPAGHERLTSGLVSGALRALPPATLVAEDASTDLVLRSLSSSDAAGGRPVRVTPRNAASVAAALGQAPVFAFPRGQRELQHRGVLFLARPSAAGLAQVDAVHGCSAVDRRWEETPALARAPRFALVATVPDARGPLTLYLGSDAPLIASAIGWQPRDMRGFHPRPYSAADRAELRLALLSQGLPASSAVLAAPHVLRLVLWRTPGAPDVLPVALSARPTAAVARLDADARRDGLVLCPSYAFEPAAIE